MDFRLKYLMKFVTHCEPKYRLIYGLLCHLIFLSPLKEGTSLYITYFEIINYILIISLSGL